MDRLLFTIICAVFMAFSFSATCFIIDLLFTAPSFFQAGIYLFWLGGAIGAFHGLTSYEEKF